MGFQQKLRRDGPKWWHAFIDDRAGIPFSFHLHRSTIVIRDIECDDYVKVSLDLNDPSDEDLLDLFWAHANDLLQYPLATSGDQTESEMSFAPGWSVERLRAAISDLQIQFFAKNQGCSYSTVVYSATEDSPADLCDYSDDTPPEIADDIRILLRQSRFSGTYREPIAADSARRDDWLTGPFTIEITSPTQALN